MKFTFSILSLFVVAGSAAASLVSPSTNLSNLDGSDMGTGYTPRNPAGVAYTVYTGLTTASNGLVQVDTSTPNGDLRIFGAAASSINPYLAALGGITRRVSDSAVSNGLGGFDLTITITGSGNLFPSGFASGSNPLTGAGVGLGLNLGVRGNAQLVFPNNIVTNASVSLVRADGSSSGFNLPPSFFPNSQTNLPWNGAVGVSIGQIATPANDLAPFVEVVWQIRTVPTPGAVAVLALGGLIATRRRRA